MLDAGFREPGAIMPHRVSRAWCLERQLGPSDWVSGVARRDTSTGRSVHLNLRQSVAAQLAGECFRRYPRPGAVISPGCRTLIRAGCDQLDLEIRPCHA